MPKSPRNTATTSTYPYQYPATRSEKGWPCKECGVAFTRKTGLKRHRQLHLPEEERDWIQCEFVGCNYKCLQRNNMKNHVHSMHTLEPIGTCQVCGRAFRDSAAFSRHMSRTHPSRKQTRKKHPKGVLPDVDIFAEDRDSLHLHRQASPVSSDDSHLPPPVVARAFTLHAPSTSRLGPVFEWGTPASLPVHHSPLNAYAITTSPQLPLCAPAELELLELYNSFDFSMPQPVTFDKAALSGGDLDLSTGSPSGFDLFDVCYLSDSLCSPQPEPAMPSSTRAQVGYVPR
ncbi:hypothetical protein OE88DRAFT_1648327 [Heliocybe sulcata]|uniref:C2H2-type domain-containing protein n=1 Tax=Heliocybe sulcata TaxID=5364 RepID=A0A5C3MN32_9AGAM|nr:hypothetical protein OE88DRAFT_1648327 [Heliocybe sulcata]